MIRYARIPPFWLKIKTANCVHELRYCIETYIFFRHWVSSLHSVYIALSVGVIIVIGAWVWLCGRRGAWNRKPFQKNFEHQCFSSDLNIIFEFCPGHIVVILLSAIIGLCHFSGYILSPLFFKNTGIDT